MNLRLVIERGGQRKRVPLREAETVLGRAHGNTLRIPSAEVSRQHCRITQKDGLVLLRDLDSVNGTFLNGTRIKQEEVVRPGDKVDVGPVTFVVEYELTPAALERLRVMHADVDVLTALAGLADGEVVECEFEDDGGLALFAQEPEAEPDPLPVADARKKKKPPRPLSDTPTLPINDLGPLKPDFDFDAGNWQLPEGGDLRGLMDGGGEIEPPPKPRKKK